MDPVFVVVHKDLCQNDFDILEAHKIVWLYMLLLERPVEMLHVSVLLGRMFPDKLASYS